VEQLEPFARAFEEALSMPEHFDMAQVHDCGAEFHMEVMRLSGNKHLLEMYYPLRLRFRIPLGIIRNRTPERVRDALFEHQELLQAIMSRESEKARHLMCEHLRKGLEFRIAMLVDRARYKI
jgi:DNA-binding GntR family transcriptional regulator